MKTAKQPKKTKAQEEAEELEIARQRFANGSPLHPKEVVLVLAKRDEKPTLAMLTQALDALYPEYRYPNYCHQVTTAVNDHWGAVDRKAAKAAAKAEQEATLVPMFELPPPVPKSERRRPGEPWRG